MAALLHDVVKDQGGPEQLDEVDGEFGPRVATIVESYSDTLFTPKPRGGKRKQRISHIWRKPSPRQFASRSRQGPQRSHDRPRLPPARSRFGSASIPARIPLVCSSLAGCSRGERKPTGGRLDHEVSELETLTGRLGGRHNLGRCTCCSWTSPDSSRSGGSSRSAASPCATPTGRAARPLAGDARRAQLAGRAGGQVARHPHRRGAAAARRRRRRGARPRADPLLRDAARHRARPPGRAGVLRDRRGHLRDRADVPRRALPASPRGGGRRRDDRRGQPLPRGRRAAAPLLRRPHQGRQPYSRLDRIVEGLFLGPSHYSIGLQCADLVCAITAAAERGNGQARGYLKTLLPASRPIPRRASSTASGSSASRSRCAGRARRRGCSSHRLARLDTC